MGPVKDIDGTVLRQGNKIEVVDDILYVQEGFEIKNKIPKGSQFIIKGFPADERYVQVNLDGRPWAITASKIRKV